VIANFVYDHNLTN